LEALSWCCSLFSTSSTGGNPRAGLRFGRWQRGYVISSLGASPWWFVVSLVCMLESLAAAAQSVSVRGRYVRRRGASWLMTSLVGFGLAARSPTLRRFWAGSALSCAFPEFKSVS
jgi:hypothetical protein